ncbi:MAG: hypothetical protein L0219_03600, partial [Phycisphaerales bacterium]|nr:hypothetical protein [Phycisphaerales bacterium]
MRYLPVIALACLAACGDAQTSGARIDPSLAAMVPPGAVMLMGVRMEALRTTALYQKLLAGQRLAVLDEFSSQNNFDLRKDVHELLVASDGG